MKRMLAMLLCLSMVLGLLPALAAAQEPAPVQTIVTAQELPGQSRLENLELPQKENHTLYTDDEMVTVIVELEEEPLLTGFTAKAGSSSGRLFIIALTRSLRLETRSLPPIFTPSE